MANDVFFKTKSWSIGSFHASLSFSSDGTTIAGTMAVNSPGYPSGKVNFWETATGAITSSINDWSFVVFSPADPDMGAVVGSNRIQMVKRKSPGGKTWRPQGESVIIDNAAMCTFRPDGKRITVGTLNGCLFEYNPVTTKNHRDFSAISVTGFAYCPIEPNLRIVARDVKYGKLRIESYAGMGGRIESYTGKGGPKVHCQLTPDPVKVYFCAWSEDGKWIATYDEHCDVCLWDASVTTSVPLERLLPRDRVLPITSLIFVLDSTALMILCGGYLSVWDIGRGAYVANSGLPAMPTNVAFDGPRNRVAVAVDNKIYLYELKLPQKTQSDPTLPGQQKPPRRNLQTQGKPSISSKLADFDITNNVVKSKPDPFVSIYFDIYRGVWNFDTPRVFQHAVAITVVLPGFNPRSEAQEIQDFEDYLIRWSNLSHDNLLPLLGVSMDFGRLPAVVTSWMTNGRLSEYIRSYEYDKMKLVIGVARGVAYLHSEGIIHSDIRASNVLVDDLGNARLADPGLFSVLTSSPLILSGIMKLSYYRWMAPELLEDSSPKTTFATDVYSVTMTSLEIFTARHPFEDVKDSFSFWPGPSEPPAQ